MLTDAEMWALIIGYISPPLIAIVQQSHWGAALKSTVMLLASLLIGGGTSYFAGDFDGRTVVTCVLTAAVAAGAAYHTLWKPSGVAPRIERSTSL